MSYDPNMQGPPRHTFPMPPAGAQAGMPAGPQRSRRTVVVTLVLVVLVGAAVVVSVARSLSSSSSSSFPSRSGVDADDLAARVLSVDGAEQVVVVDLVAARDALDLPDDQGLEEVGPSDTEARRLEAALYALPHLRFAGADAPDLTDALDSTRFTGVAGDQANRTTVIATDQPWDEIADGLVEAGYERAGDLVVLSGADSVELRRYPYTAIGYVDGVVALSSDLEGGPEAVEQLLADPDTDTESLDRLRQLDGPVRGLVMVRDDVEGAGCASAYTVDDSLGAGPVDLRVYGDEPADIELTLGDDGRAAGLIEVSGGGVEGDHVAAEVVNEASGPLLSGPTLFLLSRELVYSDIFTCA